MSTQKQSTNQYAPTGMAAYNQMTPQMASNMMQFMTNPLQSSFFQTNLGMANKNTSQQGSSMMQTLMNNMKSLGSGATNSPFFQSQVAQQGRMQSGQMQNNFVNLLNNANQMRMSATQGAAGYQPLQTGNTQTTSGLGTWLPQLLGGGLGAISGLASGGGSAASQVSAANPFMASSMTPNSFAASSTPLMPMPVPGSL